MLFSLLRHWPSWFIGVSRECHFRFAIISECHFSDYKLSYLFLSFLFTEVFDTVVRKKQ